MSHDDMTTIVDFRNHVLSMAPMPTAPTFSLRSEAGMLVVAARKVLS